MVSFNKIFNTPLVKQSFVYVVCDGINRAIPFLLLPFITYYLTPDDYGIITNFNVYVQILTVFIYSCTAGALPVMYHKLEKKDIRSYVSNMIILNSIATILCILINLIAFSWIQKGLDIDLTFQLYAILIVWFAGITNVNMILWRCEEKPIPFGIYQISQSAVNAISTILFVITFLLGWQGRIYSFMVSAILFGLVSIVILRRRGYLEFKIRAEFLKQTLFFAIPIIPHGLSTWFRSGIEKILLTNMYGLSENGLYSVALTWGSVVLMFLTAFNNAYVPYLYKKLTYIDKDRESTSYEQIQLVRLLRFCIWGTALFVLVSYFISIILIKTIYPLDYQKSILFLPWVMIVQFFQGCYLMFASFIHYSLKTKVLGITTFSWSIISIGLAWFCLKIFGPLGVTISSAFISMVISLSVVFLAIKSYSLPWRQLIISKL